MVDELRRTIGQLPAGWHGQYWPSLGSTQDVARQAVRAGAPTRSIVVADEQTAGRGRQARRWLAPPGSALLVSIVFRDQPAREPPVPLHYTMLTSAALTEAIERVVPGLRPAIKWPNDVVLDGRKVAGVLAESTWDGDQLVVIVGVGVNVDMSAEALASIGPTAASLRQASGQAVDRGRLLLALLQRIDVWLERPAPELAAAWQARLWGRGQRLRLLDLDGEHEVVVLGAEVDGSLVVRLADGSIRRGTTGELIL